MSKFSGSPNKEYDQKMQKLRIEALEDSEKVATKQRFALFSQPPSLATGDDKQYQKIYHQRDENGKPITEARNIQSTALKRGKAKDAYFSVLGFTTIGDKYIDPDSINRQYELEKKKKIKQDQVFKPPSGYKTIINSAFKHENEDVYNKKNYRDADGKVLTQSKNITTNPSSKLQSKHYPHLPDQYERQRQLRIQEMKKHQELLGEKAAFRSTVFGRRNFFNDKKTFGEEGLNLKKRPQTNIKFNIINHDAPFKPSNPNKRVFIYIIKKIFICYKGWNGTLSKFPEYKPNGEKQAKRQFMIKEKDPFKPKYCGELTRPTPTISCHPLNIRKDIMNGRVAF
ncbi:hypothetical protein IMG5_001300 [Ichthyophthirius multifiliis]|uniref:Cilia-and flagella-associated protein 96 n=1 Tax=Ichthyophthirius multifiliis TaxID=5932 RepID=G0QIS2_ICHMU|nr:hypothetical protein IMG5_001300 [Ichthyophthirius multifiliis]EGR34901.1 hypothetical protein IMG5_001300 [Ichthyophthirius multifiliis]|eukprot:XP_004040205.1 hypothetical protein IMG5_001300 [Ichthyophthirius multifiliis]